MKTKFLTLPILTLTILTTTSAISSQDLKNIPDSPTKSAATLSLNREVSTIENDSPLFSTEFVAPSGPTNVRMNYRRRSKKDVTTEKNIKASLSKEEAIPLSDD